MRFYVVYNIFLFLIINNSITSLKNIYFRKNNNFIKMTSNDRQCIISSKNNNIYCNTDADKYINENEFLTNKKIITVSPGGFKGFYLLGILTYIKEKYDVDNFIYSGASAGSWNSLFMCYKGNNMDFVYNLLDYNIKKAKSITELEYLMKYKLLTSYKDDDFDLRRLFIGVTTLKYFTPITNIFSDFESLEDAINCCIASSHIPLVTGTITNKYHNMYTFDGGFSSYPYLNKNDKVLHISPSMWDELNSKNKNGVKCDIKTIAKFSELFSISKNNLLELFDDGYHDAKNNKHHLDKIFTSKKDNNSDNNIDNTLDSEYNIEI
jgi:hypothetical protein